MIKVLIAVPTFENIMPDTFKAIYDLEKPEGVETLFEFVRGYDCAAARNRIVQKAQDLKTRLFATLHTRAKKQRTLF